jgi:hypothetical protein
MRDEIANDPVLRPFVEALVQLPPRDPALVARVLTATATAPRSVPWWERWRMPALAITALGAALMMMRGWSASPETPASTAVAAVESTASPTIARAATADGTLPATVPVQFRVVAPDAESVQLVGDFNAWDGSATAMERDANADTWSIELQLTPGRHVYAFVIDGTRWVADPTAPRMPDDDFGKPGSVVLVQAP